MGRICQKTFCTALFIVLSAAVVFSTGCAEDAPPTPQTPPASYTTRGEITQLPVDGQPNTSFMVKHEAIPDFLHADGKTRGMDTMTMAFPLAEGFDVSGLSVGDRVEVTFEVNFDPSGLSWETTAVKSLPMDTALDFSPLKPAGDPHAGHDHSHHDHGHDHSGHQH